MDDVIRELFGRAPFTSLVRAFDAEIDDLLWELRGSLGEITYQRIRREPRQAENLTQTLHDRRGDRRLTDAFRNYALNSVAFYHILTQKAKLEADKRRVEKRKMKGPACGVSIVNHTPQPRQRNGPQEQINGLRDSTDSSVWTPPTPVSRDSVPRPLLESETVPSRTSTIDPSAPYGQSPPNSHPSAAATENDTCPLALVQGPNDTKPGDIIIPIIGLTGSGKSNFINKAAGHNATEVGDLLSPCTREVVPIAIPYSKDRARRVVLVDTPGLNDQSLDDIGILFLIAQWLARSYQRGEKLAGIIFMHDITQKRIAPSNRSLSMMKDLCGDVALNNVTLVTSMWESPFRQEDVKREASLNGLWQERMGREPKTGRFDNTPASTWNIIDAIARNVPVITVTGTGAGRHVPPPKPRRGFWRKLKKILFGL